MANARGNAGGRFTDRRLKMALAVQSKKKKGLRINLKPKGSCLLSSWPYGSTWRAMLHVGSVSTAFSV